MRRKSQLFTEEKPLTAEELEEEIEIILEESDTIVLLSRPPCVLFKPASQFTKQVQKLPEKFKEKWSKTFFFRLSKNQMKIKQWKQNRRIISEGLQ